MDTRWYHRIDNEITWQLIDVVVAEIDFNPPIDMVLFTICLSYFICGENVFQVTSKFYDSTKFFYAEWNV